MKANSLQKHYEIIGRNKPKDEEPNPKLFKMNIFAPEKIVAKSKFWNLIRKLGHMKRMTGEIISVKEIPEVSSTRVKNFGICLKYESRSGTHNMYREYRDLSVAGAVTACYRDMAARHRARAQSIQIIGVQEVAPAKCRRRQTKIFHQANLRFPLFKRIQQKKILPTFSHVRPKTYFM